MSHTAMRAGPDSRRRVESHKRLSWFWLVSVLEGNVWEDVSVTRAGSHWAGYPVTPYDLPHTSVEVGGGAETDVRPG